MDLQLSDDERLKWIFGNIFFTSCIVIISFIQVYIYYHNEFEARKLCLGTFFVTAIGLLVATKNIPLSLLTAIVFSNLITNCSDVKLLNQLKPKKESALEEKKREIKELEERLKRKDTDNEKNMDNIMEEEEEKIIKNTTIEKNETVVSEPENKKMKQKYLQGAVFTPYLTNNDNKDAYPEQPNIMKFQN